MEKSTVYFTDFRCPVGTSQLDKLKKLCVAAGIKDIDMDGKFVAIKMHFGELGNLAFLRPNYAKAVADLCKEQGGMPFLTDCNTLYPGSRKNALEHLECANLNGFNSISTGCQILIGDGLRGTDEVEVPVVNGEYCKTALIGHAIMDADIFISLTHFKGHEATGFGGALKNMSIGVASAHGKAHIHGAGDPAKLWTADHDSFLESMAEADQSVMAHMGRENILYISVANRLSVDCDCDAHPHEPEMADIGIFASTDPVALDKACVDAVYASPDPGKAALIERMESRNGIHTADTAFAMGLGNLDYEIVSLD